MKVQNFKENKHPTAIKKSQYLKNHFDEINVWDVTIRIKYKFQMKIKLSKLSYSLNCIRDFGSKMVHFFKWINFLDKIFVDYNEPL